jgi:hypothetical protein
MTLAIYAHGKGQQKVTVEHVHVHSGVAGSTNGK